MGRILLIGRLAARDLRRRRAEAVLMLLAITAATATLTLGLVLHGVTSQPYQRDPGGDGRARTWSPSPPARPRTAAAPASLTALDRRARRHRPQRALPVACAVAASGRPHRLNRRGWQRKGATRHRPRSTSRR